MTKIQIRVRGNSQMMFKIEEEIGLSDKLIHFVLRLKFFAKRKKVGWMSKNSIFQTWFMYLILTFKAFFTYKKAD